MAVRYQSDSTSVGVQFTEDKFVKAMANFCATNGITDDASLSAWITTNATTVAQLRALFIKLMVALIDITPPLSFDIVRATLREKESWEEESSTLPPRQSRFWERFTSYFSPKTMKETAWSIVRSVIVSGFISGLLYAGKISEQWGVLALLAVSVPHVALRLFGTDRTKTQ